MSALSNYTENKVLDHLLSKGTASYTPPAQLYVALFTDSVSPDDNGPITEVSGGAYARQTATFAPANAGTSITSADITYPVATAAWGTVTYLAVYDAPTGGNTLFYGSLNSSKLIEANDQFKILAGDFSISLD